MTTNIKSRRHEEVLKSLRIVELHRPYDLTHHPRTQELISKIIDFKVQSYKAEYPYGVVPFGAHDLVGSHLLVCQSNSDGTSEIITGFKAITLAQCQESRLKFPALAICDTSPKHYDATESLMKNGNPQGNEVAYIGSWAVSPEARKNRRLLKISYDLIAALVGFYCLHNQIKLCLTFAATRFKVEKFHSFMGFRPINENGNHLEEFPCYPFYDEPIRSSALDARDLTPAVQELMENYLSLWKNREQINADEQSIAA